MSLAGLEEGAAGLAGFRGHCSARRRLSVGNKPIETWSSELGRLHRDHQDLTTYIPFAF